MPAEVLEHWLQSHQPARIRSQSLRPMEHPVMPGTPLTIQRGQAETVVLQDDNSQRWILKKFHTNCRLDRNYLESVTRLLPHHEAFQVGTERAVLGPKDLGASGGSGGSGGPSGGGDAYHSRALAQWLDGCLLMPCVQGMDWATLADELRDRERTLSADERIALGRSLCDAVAELERYDLAHRDLSSGNVFFNIATWSAALIDFDSLFGPYLSMPAATTCGTVGYTAPFAWRNGQLEALATWRPGADRYALAILCAELLLLDVGSPLTAEGGMFDQAELRARSGKGIQDALDRLQAQSPAAAALFERTIASRSFDDCPSPEDWLTCWNAAPVVHITPPSVADLEPVDSDYFRKVLAAQRPAAPLWPAPRIDELPDEPLVVPKTAPAIPAYAVDLPANPWRTGT